MAGEDRGRALARVHWAAVSGAAAVVVAAPFIHYRT